jgi:hypothetical protein
VIVQAGHTPIVISVQVRDDDFTDTLALDTQSLQVPLRYRDPPGSSGPGIWQFVFADVAVDDGPTSVSDMHDGALSHPAPKYRYFDLIVGGRVCEGHQLASARNDRAAAFLLSWSGSNGGSSRSRTRETSSCVFSLR